MRGLLRAAAGIVGSDRLRVAGRGAEWRHLERAFAGAAERREGLVRACEARAARWVWATPDAPPTHPAPFWAERNEIRSGRTLAKRPSRIRNHEELGFDGEGRLVAVREWSGEELAGQRCYEYRDDGTTEVVAYGRGGSVEEVMLLGHADGVVSSVEHFAVEHWGRERLCYDDDRLVAVETYYDNETWPREARPSRSTDRLTYSPTGELRTIVRTTDDGRTWTVHTSGAAVPTVGELVGSLADGIAARVEHAAPAEPVFGILLELSGGERTGQLPPAVYVGFDSARRAGSMLWAAGRGWAEVEIRDGDLTAMSEGFLTDEANREVDVRSLAEAVADRLAEHEWHALRPTEDFEVRVVDRELDDPAPVAP